MSGSRPRQPSTEEVNNVAVIAAWCDSPAHLAPAPVDAYLSDSGHRALCTVVARAWDPCNPTRSQDLEGLLEGEAAEESGVPRTGSQQHLSPEELSQRSVDLLLRSYYQMVQDNHKRARSSKGTAAGPNALQKAFLLLCQPLPLNLRMVFKAASAVVVAISYLLAFFSFIFVPLWLVLIRHCAASGLWRPAAAVTVYGLLAFLAADHIYRSAETKRRRQRKGAVTSANVASVLQDAARSYHESPYTASAVNGPTHNPAAALGAVATAGTSSGARTGAGTSNPVAGSSNPVAGSSNPVAGSSGSSNRALERVRADLAALQRGVYGSGGEVAVELSEAGVEAELRRICTTVGLEFRHTMTGSAEALANTVRELRHKFGV